MSVFPFSEGVGTQEQMVRDPVWNGVPPVGDRPIVNRWKFLWYVGIVFIVKLVIWGAYRLVTGNAWPFTDPGWGSQATFWVGMVAKPLLQLGPVFLLWWFLFKEKGLPFRFTRKNLASSLAWGLSGAVLFFVVATTSMVVLINVLGYGSNFRMVAGWNEVGWGLIIAMMFSFMIGTGPTEEIFSRGFIQDQTARAFPIWFAMVFSAVLFAIGHLPISIFMYHMSAEAIFWYMLVLFVMGMFFSLLYQWSRNILLTILIHGLWDWYLSLFALKGDYTQSFLANSDILFGRIDFFNTLITLAIMIPFFYFLYRRFWRRDLLSTGSPLEMRRSDNRIFRWLKDRDQGDWPLHPVSTVVGVTFIFCLLMFPTAAIVGADDPASFSDGILDFKGRRVEVREWDTLLKEGHLSEHQEETIPIPSNGTEVTRVNVSLQWSDEPDAGPRYTNQPDSFSIFLLDGNGSELGREQGASGHISIIWIEQDEAPDLGNLSVVVTLVKTGDQEPLINIIGLRDRVDGGNDYNLRIDFETYRVEYRGGSDDADVRW